MWHYGAIINGANSYTWFSNLYAHVLNNWNLKNQISNVKVNSKTLILASSHLHAENKLHF
jgi:hypothetical protein